MWPANGSQRGTGIDLHHRAYRLSADAHSPASWEGLAEDGLLRHSAHDQTACLREPVRGSLPCREECPPENRTAQVRNVRKPGPCPVTFVSGKRDLNSRPSPWQGARDFCDFRKLANSGRAQRALGAGGGPESTKTHRKCIGSPS
jgi:hypothetical protein